MNLRRRTTTVLIAGALALSLIAAGEPAAPRGTASTSLTAVELGVSDLPGVTVIDLGSYASTDTDPVRNALGNGVSWSRVGIDPIAVGDTVLGAAEATSDGDNSVTAELISWEDPAGLVTALVNPVGLSATATAVSAVGAAQAATAQLDALDDALGLTINTTGVVSSVSSTASTATQGLHVEGLDVDLGDLVPLDVLSLLPIDVLIELLDQLPVGVPDLEGIVDGALDAVTAADAAAEALTAAGEQLAEDLVALADANQVLSDLDAILASATAAEDTANTALTAAQATLASAEADLAALLLAPLDFADFAAQCGIGVPTLENITTCLEDAVAAAQATVDSAQTAVNNAVDAAQTAAADVATAQAAVDALQAAIDAAIDALQQLVDDVVDALTKLVTALTTLEGSLGDVVAALADGDILSVGAIDVGVVANAVSTLEGSSATVGCNAVPVAVLGLNVATPDCSNPLTTVSSVAATITDSIQGLLQTLPVAQDVLPAVSIEVFPVVQESVVRDGDYVTAMARVVPLDLSLGSVTIDPANLVSGLLDTLAAQVDALVAAAIPADGEVTGLGLPGEGELLTALQGVRDTLPSVDTLQAQLDAILAQLPDGTGLPVLETPSLDLLVDPTSTASFAPGVAAPDAGGTPTPDPAPGDDPDLPATGGGLALLGLLSLGGAYTLRRRR